MLYRDVEALRTRLAELNAVAEHLPPEVVAKRLLAMIAVGVEWDRGEMPDVDAVVEALERQPGETAIDAFHREDLARLRQDDFLYGIQRTPTFSERMGIDTKTTGLGTNAVTEEAADDAIRDATVHLYTDPNDPDAAPFGVCVPHAIHRFREAEKIGGPDHPTLTSVYDEEGIHIVGDECIDCDREMREATNPDGHVCYHVTFPDREATDHAEELAKETVDKFAQHTSFIVEPASTEDLPDTPVDLSEPVEIPIPTDPNDRPGDPPDEVPGKECGRCKEWRPIDGFQRHWKSRRRISVCKVCISGNRHRGKKKPPDPPDAAGSTEEAQREDAGENVGEPTGKWAGWKTSSSRAEIRPTPKTEVVKKVEEFNPDLNSGELSDEPDREPYVDEEGRRRCANRARCVNAINGSALDAEPAYLNPESPHIICRGCRKRAGVGTA